MSEVLFISIKPEFTRKIFSGEKTIELRKSVPNVERSRLVVIYCTDPVKAVIGVSKIKKILKLPPMVLWERYSDQLGIDQRRFEEYYEDSQIAVGIKLTGVIKLDTEISLDLIKKNYPLFSPPQTFKYFSKNEVYKGYKNVLECLY